MEYLGILKRQFRMQQQGLSSLQAKDNTSPIFEKGSTGYQLNVFFRDIINKL